MRFSTFGGRAGIYARVTAQRFGGLSALVKRKQHSMASISLEFRSTLRFVQWLLQQFLFFLNSIRVIRSHSRLAFSIVFRLQPAYCGSRRPVAAVPAFPGR